MLGAATIAGALVGAGDALAASLRHRSDRIWIGLLIDSASFGAAVGLLATAPLAILAALLRRPRTESRAIGWVTAYLATMPATLALARDLHKRIPWGLHDILPALGGVAALVLLILVAGESVAFGLGLRGPRLFGRLARIAPAALVLLVPAAIRGAAVLRGPDGGLG